jgi:hypothetical protein
VFRSESYAYLTGLKPKRCALRSVGGQATALIVS